jgi:hypothetical protein
MKATLVAISVLLPHAAAITEGSKACLQLFYDEGLTPTQTETCTHSNEKQYEELKGFASNCSHHEWYMHPLNWCIGGPEIRLEYGSGEVVFCAAGAITDPCTGNIIYNGDGAVKQTHIYDQPGVEQLKWKGVTCFHDSGTDTPVIKEIEIPQAQVDCSMQDFDLTTIHTLETLDLSENSINGTLPLWIGDMVKLTSFHATHNRIAGTIPPEIFTEANHATINDIQLSNNLLSGKIPTTIGLLRSLATFKVDHNMIEGPLPDEKKNMEKIQKLFLGHNKFHGAFPNFTAMPHLQQLRLNDNDPGFTGQLPHAINLAGTPAGGCGGEHTNCSNLQELHIGGNRFTGPLPVEIRDLTKLDTLDASNNSMSGFIPSLPTHLLEEWDADRHEVNLDGPHQNWWCPFPPSSSHHPAFLRVDCTCMPGSFCPSNNTARGSDVTDTFCEYDCENCGPGSYSNTSWSMQCTLCEVGKATPTDYSTSCKVCNPGHFTTARGTAVCDFCRPGNEWSGSGVECTMCAPGFEAPANATVDCNECTPGSVAPDHGTANCEACKPGSASLGNTTHCTTCSPGTFADGRYNATIPKWLGSLTCDLCPAGYAAASAGAASCDICPPGSASNGGGSDACTPCPAGSFAANFATDVCLLCAAGQYRELTNGTRCDECGSGSITDTGAAEGAVSCTLCGIGKYSLSSDVAACTDCTAGTFVGEEGSNEESDCTMCAAGSITNTGTSAGASTCTLCVAGKYSSASDVAACTDCVAGSITNTGVAPGAVTCTPCASGKYSLQSSVAVCNDCTPGKFVGVVGSNTEADCTTCAAGLITNTGIASGASTCTLCVAGKYTTTSNVAACLACNAGSITNTGVEAGADTCTSCASGKYSLQSYVAACTACAPGKYVFVVGSNEEADCVACAAGHVTDKLASAGATKCVACNPGLFSALPTVACADCPAGQLQPGGKSTSCDNCPLGSAQPLTGQTSCDKCGIGQFAEATGLAACRSCSAGRHSADHGRESSCEHCPAGHYQPDDGKHVCLTCPEGKYSLVGTTDAEVIACTLCPAGKHQHSAISDECDECAVGKYSDDDGLVDCIDCATGTYQHELGKIICVDCTAGKYQPKVGQSASEDCLNAPSGTHAVDGPGEGGAGSSAVADCTAGTYGRPFATAVLSCKACPAGKFASAPASIECIASEPGYYAPLPEGGSRTANVGAAQELKCVRMTFTSSAEQGACKVCPKGKYNNVDGSTKCSSLAPGLEAATTQFVHVEVAIAGMTAAEFGDDEEGALKEAIVATLREAGLEISLIDIVNIQITEVEASAGRRLAESAATTSTSTSSRRLATTLKVDFDISLPEADDADSDEEVAARLEREKGIASAMGSAGSGSSSAAAFTTTLVSKLVALDPTTRTGTVEAAVEEAGVQARVDLVCTAGSVISAPSAGMESCTVCQAGKFADESSGTCAECANKGAGALFAEEFSDEGAAVCRKCLSVLELRTDGQCYIHIIVIFIIFLILFISICCCCRYFASTERQLLQEAHYSASPKADLHMQQQRNRQKQQEIEHDHDAVRKNSADGVQNPMAPHQTPYNAYLTASQTNLGGGSQFNIGNPGQQSAGRQDDAAIDRPRATTAAQELAKRRKPDARPPPPDTPYDLESTDSMTKSSTQQQFV